MNKSIAYKHLNPQIQTVHMQQTHINVIHVTFCDSIILLYTLDAHIDTNFKVFYEETHSFFVIFIILKT